MFLLFGAHSIASYAIEVRWWKELGQFNTWLSMLYYAAAPVAGATLLAFAALWVAHGGTLVTTHSRHSSMEARNGHLSGGMERGMSEGYERLDALIAKLA